jgi:hypothetical protein
LIPFPVQGLIGGEIWKWNEQFLPLTPTISPKGVEGACRNYRKVLPSIPNDRFSDLPRSTTQFATLTGHFAP